MPSDTAPRKVRRGTRSCTECRRRKLRCIWSSDGASKCRRCEDRGSDCVAQVFAQPSTAPRRLTTRDRVSRLEQHIAGLTEAVRTIEARVGGGKDGGAVRLEAFHAAASDSGSSDDDSSMSDVPITNTPTYLNSLFDNNLISLDNREAGDAHQQRILKATSHLAGEARKALRPLIPPRGDVVFIASRASWLLLLHSLFPSPLIIKSGEEMVSQYDEMMHPAADVMSLATWLLSIALTAQQMPREELKAAMSPRWSQGAHGFSRVVVEAVESRILSRDILLGTVEGIETAILLLRLQISRGNFKRTWLQLRRIIAIAELIGLPRAPDGPRPVLWESICSVDRLSCMMFALPPATRHYPRRGSETVVLDGQVSPAAYISRLSEIAVQLEDVSDVPARHLSASDLYTAILKVDGDLRTLASQTPHGWWDNPESLPLPHRLLQYFHNYITMRTHLPIVLRLETSAQFGFSRMVCMQACFAVVRGYVALCSQIPDGFFVRRILDLQAFTAVVLLLLDEHGSSSRGREPWQTQPPETTKTLVTQVTEAMASVPADLGSDFARQAVTTIRSLSELLDRKVAASTSDNLVLRVPLLGKIHVSRRQPVGDDPVHSQSLGQQLAQQSSLPDHPQPLPAVMFPAQDVAAWGPYSWSIEDNCGSLFHETFMAEDFSPLGPQNDDAAVFGWDQNFDM